MPAASRLVTGGGFIVAFQHCGVTPAQNKHCKVFVVAKGGQPSPVAYD